MISSIRPAIVLLVLFTVLTGAAYPLLVTGVSQVIFPHQANGSLIREGDRVRGSALIGQPFGEPGRFWSRPSATGPHGYNAGASSGSNAGPTNPAFLQAVKDRVAALHDAEKAAGVKNDAPVPVDLVTASGSGLDPHISPAAAEYQIARVAAVSGVPERDVRELVAKYTYGRFVGLLGEPAVNVLELNLALEKLKPAP
ncbi:MAG: potassium-transporting ATPase subunit KdpC [Planctomycetes bacterium]|nr:potassium-transporting ATPase subunit KdpC [Planctomycetota bacterium]